MQQTEQRHTGDLASLRIHRPQQSRRERGMIRKLTGWLIAVALVIALGLFGYSRWIAPRMLPEVEVLTVRATVNVANPPTLTTSGYLVAERQASVTPKISGRVIRVNFDVGSKVRAGDLMLVLESDELRAQLDEARAAAAEAEREYQRNAALWKEGVSARALLDTARAQLDMARARLARLQVVLRDSVVRAPISGTVTTKNVEIGELVTPNVVMQGTSSTAGTGALAVVADLSTLEVEADVNEANLGQIRPGQPAEISVDAAPGRKFRGHLRQIVPTANRAKGVVQVKVAIDEKAEVLLPEMSASVSFLQREQTTQELDEKPKIRVPVSAVVNADDQSRVAVLTGKNVVQLRRVQLGTTGGGRVEVVSGLANGDRIVTSNPSELNDGQRVRLPEKEQE